MKLFFPLLPVSLATISPHRTTVLSRIERMTEHIADTRSQLDRRIHGLVERKALFESMLCADFVSNLSELDASVTQHHVINDIREADFLTRWVSYPPALKQEFCSVLSQIIVISERRNSRQERSIIKLTHLREMYRSILLAMDRQESVDQYLELFDMGSRFEFYEVGLRTIPQVLHEVVQSENNGPIFWDPSETSQVVRDLIAEIMDEGDDFLKIRLCFERILGSRTMHSHELQMLVKEILGPYKIEFRQLGDDLLNTETALLEEFQHT